MTVFSIEPRHRVSYPKRMNSLIIKNRKIVKKTRLNVLSCNFNCKSSIVRAVCSLIFFSHNRLAYWGMENRNFVKGTLILAPTNTLEIIFHYLVQTTLD